VLDARPFLNVRALGDSITGSVGSPQSHASLQDNSARATALASGDYDEDGITDLLSAHATASGGFLILRLGNVRAIYPHSIEAARLKPDGSASASPFIGPALIFELVETPDFLAAGDFDADGHWDVVTASSAGTSLYLYSGDGRGAFAPPRLFGLPGSVTHVLSGEVNRADGLADLAVAVAGPNGAKVLVFESPRGALSSDPETVHLQTRASGLVVQDMNNDSFADIAVGTGRELAVVSGRDRHSLVGKGPGSQATAAIVGRQDLPFTVTSLVAGNFTASPGDEFALLGDDGAIHVVSRALKDNLNQIAEWKHDLLTPVVSSRSAKLIRADLSTSSMDDLLITDTVNNQLSLVIPESAMESTTSEERKAGFRTVVALDSSPTAVLPMRLNADAISDLVILKSNSSMPVLVLSAQLTFTVSNPNDAGPGSLRAAITLANSNSGLDLIDFNISPGGPQTITPLSALPTITDPVTIDGTTQPGFGGTPIIELNGSSVPPGTNGLLITAGSSTVRGLVINRFPGNSDAIELQTNGGNIIEGNFLGTDSSGTLALPNGTGVFINGPPNNTVGGTTSAARNLISGNGRGIAVLGIGARGNLVQGNFIWHQRRREC
jgi:FG-GAP-like repeat